MTTVVEVDHDDARVLDLRTQMSDEMAELYGRQRHGVPAEGIDPASVVATVLVLDDGEPVATAALRRMPDPDGGPAVEVKRMYLVPAIRGSGLAGRLLADMERRAHAVGVRRVLLHTGQRQRAALALYDRSGYERIAVFPPYDEVPESVCLAKVIGDAAVM